MGFPTQKYHLSPVACVYCAAQVRDRARLDLAREKQSQRLYELAHDAVRDAAGATGLNNGSIFR